MRALEGFVCPLSASLVPWVASSAAGRRVFGMKSLWHTGYLIGRQVTKLSLQFHLPESKKETYLHKNRTYKFVWGEWGDAGRNLLNITQVFSILQLFAINDTTPVDIISIVFVFSG